MPTIPVTSAQRVAPSGTPAIRATPDTFGVPRPVDLSGIEEQVGQEIHEANQIAVSDADAQIVRAKTSRLWDPRTGAMQARGKDAIPAREQAEQGFQDDAQKIEASLTNDVQKAAFRTRVSQHYADLGGQLGQHVATQIKRYDTQQTYGHVDALAASALASYQDERSVQASINDTRATLTDFWRRNGHGEGDGVDQFAQQHITDRISAVRFAVLGQIADAGNDQATAAYVAQHLPEFTGKDLVTARKVAAAATTQYTVTTTADRILGINQPQGIAGLVTPGNIDLTKRPRVQNGDGSVSTVRSISIEEDGKTILIPTVVGKKVVSDDEAIAHFKKTSENLGTFKDEASADSYAKRLHSAQADALVGKGNGAVAADGPKPYGQAVAEAEAIPDGDTRHAVLQQVDAHYARVERAAKLVREGSFERLAAQVDKDGTINKASPDFIALQGHVEERLLLAQQKQRLHPPADPGDPDAYLSRVILSASGAQGHDTFLQESPQDWRKAGMNTQQITHLVQMQNRAAGADDKHDEAKAVQSENIRMQRESALLKAVNQYGGVGAKITPESKKLLDAETARIRLHFDNMAAAHGNLTPALPSVQPTRQMLEDAAQRPDYAAALRKMGVALPKHLPAVPHR